MTFGLLVDRQLDAGRIDDAIAACAHGLQVANETQNHFWDAELHRLRGDLELRRAGGTADEALVHYRRALLVARAQRARSLELRAAVSTARVLAEGGRREEARTLVAPIFESFAQGLETFDLRAASALLADVA
jgi:predicted ATPase